MVWLYAYGHIPKGHLVDHINGDKQDNRLANLRLATPSENLANRRPSRSGFKGVSRKGSSWAAYVSNGNQTIHVGTFPTAVEAARAYDVKAEELYGEFALTNEKLGLLHE